jgi:thiamine-monophosphate kinase
MLDLSDGLAKDAHRIARASNVTLVIDRAQLSGFEAMLEEPAMRIGETAIDWVIGGGEDHSLLATFAPDAVIPRAFKPIGRVISRGPANVLLDAQPLAERGWDSFAS